MSGSKYEELLERKVDNIKPDAANLETATFAAGCFWGVELTFQRIPGVAKTAVGYTDGDTDNPTYREVCSGTTGHAEAVQIDFSPEDLTFRELCDVLFERHDPTTLNRQGNDAGTQYRSGIYYRTDEQKKAAEEAIKAAQAKLGAKKIVTELKPFTKFWEAEDNHQQYLEKGGQCARKGDKTSIRCYG